MQNMRGGRETNRIQGAIQPCLIPTLRGFKIKQNGGVNALDYRHYGNARLFTAEYTRCNTNLPVYSFPVTYVLACCSRILMRLLLVGAC